MRLQHSAWHNDEFFKMLVIMMVSTAVFRKGELLIPTAQRF